MTIPIASSSPLGTATRCRVRAVTPAVESSPNVRFSGKLDWAKEIHHLLPPANLGSLHGYNLEDLSFRLGLIPAVYAPQQYLAMKYKQQPWETLLRNTLVLIGSLTIIHWTRGPFNTFVNNFMTVKKDAKDLPDFNKLTGWAKIKAQFDQKLFNPRRPDFNYLESLFKAGIKLESLGVKFDKPKGPKTAKNALEYELYELFKANPKPIDAIEKNPKLKAVLMKKLNAAIEKSVYWSKMDLGRKKLVLSYRTKLLDQIKALPPSSSKRAELQKSVDMIENTMKRIFKGRLAGAAISAVFTALVVGIWIQKVVFKLAAPLDKKYTPIIPGRPTYNNTPSQAKPASLAPFAQVMPYPPYAQYPTYAPQPMAMMPQGGRP